MAEEQKTEKQTNTDSATAERSAFCFLHTPPQQPPGQCYTYTLVL